RGCRARDHQRRPLQRHARHAGEPRLRPGVGGEVERLADALRRARLRLRTAPRRGARGAQGRGERSRCVSGSDPQRRHSDPSPTRPDPVRPLPAGHHRRLCDEGRAPGPSTRQRDCRSDPEHLPGGKLEVVEQMKIYAFDLMPWPYLDAPSHYPDSNALFDPVRAQQVYAEHLDQMVLYEDYGFDAIGINEHHAKPYGLMPSPNLIAAPLSQRTRRIKIAILGNLPALHDNPVRLAEEIAMLDCLSGGRLISGFVRGVPQEYLALSGSLDGARERLREAWD